MHEYRPILSEMDCQPSPTIVHPQFLRWKKRYHLLKSGQHPPTATLIEQLLTRTQMLGPTAGSQLPAPSLQQEKPHPSLVHIAKSVALAVAVGPLVYKPHPSLVHIAKSVALAVAVGPLVYKP